jgi:competence protein ComEC
MIPIVHYFFSTFSWLQLYSPLLSILFVLFYPLELLLHLIGQGSLLDTLVLQLLHQPAQIYSLTTPFWFLLFYLALSIVAIRFRYAALLLPLFAVLPYLLSS